MNQYIVNLNCRVDAKTVAEARTKALENLQINEATPTILTPINVYELLREFHNKKREFFIALFLDTQNNLLKREVISIGTLNSSLIHPREVYRQAIAEGCAAIIVAHNHPSGYTQPSEEDLAVTRRLVDAGRIIGISLLDHIVVSRQGYYSLKEHNQM